MARIGDGWPSLCMSRASMLPIVGKGLPSRMPWPRHTFFLADGLSRHAVVLIGSVIMPQQDQWWSPRRCDPIPSGTRMTFGDPKASSLHHRLNSSGQHLGWLPASDTWSPDGGTGDVTRCYARCAGHRIKIVATDHDEDKQLDELHVPRTFKRLIAAMAAEPAILTNPSREREF